MVLRLNDPGDASLADIRERLLPVNQPPGRIMIEGQPDPLEVQVALLDPDPSGPAQVAALRRIGGHASGCRARQRPMRVDALPARITLEEALRLDPLVHAAIAGVGDDRRRRRRTHAAGSRPGRGWPRADGRGPPRSGRSTTLMTMALSLLARDAGAGDHAAPFAAAVAGRPARGARRARPARQPDEVTSATGDRDRFVVLLDDAELLFNGPMSKPLEEILASGRDAEHGLIIAGATGDLTRAFSGFIKEALKSRCGVLVAVDSPGRRRPFGIRLPRNAGPRPVGRGLLVRPGTVAPVQLALPD